jgi:TP901 family phage tail tape measure protein
MADVNANIGVNIDTSQALAQLKSLQRQISQFHTSIAKSSETAAIAQQSLSKNLINSINSIGAFSAELRTVKTTSESFTNSLEKNKFSMREYFRYAGGATKTFGKLFRSEFDTISNVAEERVKRLQTQYIKLGRDSSGAMKSIAVMPTSLNMEDYNTKLQIAAQRQQLFNQLMRQGSTNLINFGKNTQWAGRQLMVGFTIPLSILGNTASRAFMEMETQAIKFKKVYGDLFTPQEETQQALADVQSLASMFTQYGIAASQTVGLAAEAAAAGFSGVDLQRQTAEATRLSVLGQIDAQKALETTISLQNAFKMSSDQLAGSINFLNAVENQTVVSLDDITTAIPKVAPIIQQLGGDVKDLAFFMAAMKEGGVNASEGANALKSGLAALINPTEKASAMLAGMGINIKGIIETNKGDLKNTVVEFARSLDTLDPLTRARAIEQLFGKFQFARLSTLFANVIQDGNQASRVLNLAGSTIEELSQLAEQELELTAGSSMNKFKKAVEDLKIALVPVGETFLSAITPIVDFIGAILEKFNNLSSGAKRVITILTVGLGAVGPVLLMTFGLLANGVGNLIKLFLTLRGGYQRLTGQTNVLGQQTQYMTSEQLDAAAAAHSLDQAHAKLTQQFLAEAGAVMQLRNAYLSAIKAGQNFSLNNPGSMLRPKKFAQGVVSVPGSGNRDTVPAMLTPGEAVIPKKMAQKYGGLINGMISDNIPGFKKGLGVGDLKKSLGLFRAPYAVMKQTGGMTWDTLPAELEAVERAASEILNKTVSDVQKVNERLGNLKRKQASHIVPDITSVEMGGSQVDIKNWNAGNLQADLGYVNSYVNTIQQSNTIVENFNKQHLDKAALTLNMSMDEVSQELTKLKQGIHPTTRKAAQVLQQVAMTDAGYQGQAAAAGLGARLSGNYYETLGSRQYDPAKNINAAKTVDKKIQRLERELILRSEAMGTSAVNATAKAAGTASPSKKTIKIGEDIARGLEVGMQNRQGNVARVSKQLGETAVTKSGLIVPKSAVGGSAPLSSLSSSAAFTESAIKGTETVNKMAVFNERMSRMNNIIMGSTFALTSLAGVGSMAGGALGEFSSTIFKYSGLLFGLMSITQLLTQAKIAELAATRLSIASNAVKAAGGGMGIAGRGLAARSGILGIIGKLSVGLRAFLGPIGLATIALTAAFAIIKKVNSVREEERKSLYAFGNAIKTTKDQLKSTGEYFGIIPTRTGLENITPEKRVSNADRAAINQFKESDTFGQYKDTIDAVSRLSNADATLALQTKGAELLGKGFSQDNVNVIITAIQEAAGKSDLNLNFKTVKLEDLDKDIKTGLTAKLSALPKFINETMQKEMYMNDQGQWLSRMVMSPEAIAEIDNQGQAIKAYLNGLSGMVANGQISFEKFNQSFIEFGNLIKTSIPNEAQQMSVLDAALKQVGGRVAEAAIQVKGFEDKLLLARAAAMGLNLEVSNAMTNALVMANAAGATADDFIRAAAVRADIEKAMVKANKDNIELNKKLTGGAGGSGEKTWLQKLIEQTAGIKTQTEAFYKLRDAGYSFAEAMELASNPEFAKGIVQAAEKGGKAWNAATAAITKYKEAQEALKLAEIAGMDRGDYELQRLNKAQAYIDLQSHFIKMEYSAQLESIAKSQEENDLLLQRIGYQETLINNRYNPIIDRLQKIESLNKSISEIESRRLDVVSALSSGDISGGVKALQELRATRAAQTSQSQIDNLNAAKEREVSLLTQNNLTRDQIDLQNQKLSLDRREIELTISKKENALTYFNMTKTQIDNAARALDLAKSAGVDINSPSFLTNVLDAALGKTKSLKLAADEAAASFAAMLGKQEAARATNIPTAAPTITTIPQLFTTTGVGGTKITTPWDTGAGSPIRRSMGGIVPKYFANGGMSRGTDTIPAMLTPGEYVVRKSAVDALGVGAMNNINNGKASSNSVYNYSLSVNVDGTSANANDIARVVMSEIKKVDQQRIRGIR